MTLTRPCDIGIMLLYHSDDLLPHPYNTGLLLLCYGDDLFM